MSQDQHTFKSFNFLPDLDSFFSENKITRPTEVQRKSIPSFLNGEDLSILAQTGTGKTLSYALPLFHLIKKNDEDIEMEEQFATPRAIILTPTRELNSQVHKVLKSVAHHCKLRVRVLVGGEKGKRSRKISEEAYDILVASPARLISGLERKEVSTKLLEFLILDEADQLLDMGFTKDLQKLTQNHIKNKVQTCLYSATWPAQFENFVSSIFESTNFKNIICQGGVQLKNNIETFNIALGEKEKMPMLEAFLKQEAKGTGVVFVNRKETVEKVGTYAKELFPRRKIHLLHGELTSGVRSQTFKSFYETGGVLIASDIAARGLDIKGLKWVLNYDLPFEAVYYVHRCGRTGRDGSKGKVFNFVTTADANLISRINEAILSQSSLSLAPVVSPVKKQMRKKEGSAKTQKKVAKKTGQKSSIKKKATRKKTPRYKVKNKNKR